ncbi:MAG: hypothetical protein ACLFTK_09345 [Anaerolineales bacterium]
MGGLLIALAGWGWAVGASSPDPRVRVLVDGTWYACEAAPPPIFGTATQAARTATPAPGADIFATATAWRPPPTPTPEAWQAYVVLTPRLNIRSAPNTAPESYAGGLAAGDVVWLTDATTVAAGYVWRQRGDGLWLAERRLSDGARFLAPR